MACYQFLVQIQNNSDGGKLLWSNMLGLSGKWVRRAVEERGRTHTCMQTRSPPLHTHHTQTLGFRESHLIKNTLSPILSNFLMLHKLMGIWCDDKIKAVFTSVREIRTKHRHFGSRHIKAGVRWGLGCSGPLLASWRKRRYKPYLQSGVWWAGIPGRWRSWSWAPQLQFTSHVPLVTWWPLELPLLGERHGFSFTRMPGGPDQSIISLETWMMNEWIFEFNGVSFPWLI